MAANAIENINRERAPNKENRRSSRVKLAKVKLATFLRRSTSSRTTLRHVKLRAWFSFFQLTKYLSHRQLFVFIFLSPLLPSHLPAVHIYYVCVFRWKLTTTKTVAAEHGMGGGGRTQKKTIKITHNESDRMKRWLMVAAWRVDAPSIVCSMFLIRYPLRWCGRLGPTINCWWQIRESGIENRYINGNLVQLCLNCMCVCGCRRRRVFHLTRA